MSSGTRQLGGGLWLALLLIVVVSGLFLALQYHHSPDSLRTLFDSVKSIGDPPPPPDAPESANAPRRSDRIISCTAPDGTSFYTNALRCEDADLDNRVTEIPAQRPPLNPDVGRNCLDPDTPHQFRQVCAEPFRQALELEARLAQAADPAATPEAGEYCALIAQGVHAGCPASNAVFCYLPVCQQRARQSADP